MKAIVISNHKAEPKTEEMLRIQFGVDEVEYFQHPEIDPESTKEAVWALAGDFLGLIAERIPFSHMRVAIVNGEYGFSTACVHFLEANRVECYYPTSKRGAKEEILPGGAIKTVHIYEFVGFRRW